MKRIALLAFFLFIYSTPNPGDAKSGSLKYSNVEYGFAVVLPSGLSHEESRPPAPQHGTVIQLGTGARIWIDGSYDAGFLGSAKAALRQILSDEGIGTSPPLRSRKLSGLDAVEASYFKDDKLTVRVVAFRPRKEAVSIIYTLGLDADRLHVNEDKMIFNRIVRGFTLLSLPN